MRSGSGPRRRNPVAGLLLNAVLPGLGSLVAGRRGEGKLQLFLLVLGVVTIPFLVGFALLAGVWVWAVAAGVQDVFFSNS